ncbi:MAG: phenylalanine--tRNA ligase subunit alpha, partial [Crenarchaeota archaeon]|nr:phenylalanine--tRNA ligase subunit alpha [Thermoproteota archaeon]MDW8034370.1 phenylalanine--tRNA ligase subunit alpha [Nitrososphaerota archaeon]
EALRKTNRALSFDEICKLLGVNESSVASASYSLFQKGFVELFSKTTKYVQLTPEGEYHSKHGLPERRLVKIVLEKGGRIPLEEARETYPDKSFFTIALGWLRKKGWGIIQALNGTPHIIIEKEPPEGADESALRTVASYGSLEQNALDSESVKLLTSRGLVKTTEKAERIVSITEAGRTVELKIAVTQLTPELIRSGEWKRVELKPYDITADVEPLFPGRMHPLTEFIKEVKEIFTEMGFTEVKGPIIESCFWNFDALFTPQDHPAREMQDTFYLLNPSSTELEDRELVEKVKKTHENGWETGSTGWGGKWSEDTAKKLVLRTHTTCVSVRYLAEHKDPPVKVFSVDRVFRNERISFKSLAEFHQIEGIIMDEGVTLRDLKGVLTEFYRKLGLEKVQFWPSYFPYTEPSMNSVVYVPQAGKWLELCGMGIFRPEVTKPLGIEHPVLAWGGGLERLLMLKLGITDIRILYQNDLGWLRRVKTCL